MTVTPKPSRSVEGWPVQVAVVSACSFVAQVKARGEVFTAFGHSERSAKRAALKRARIAGFSGVTLCKEVEPR